MSLLKELITEGFDPDKLISQLAKALVVNLVANEKDVYNSMVEEDEGFVKEFPTFSKYIVSFSDDEGFADIATSYGDDLYRLMQKEAKILAKKEK